MAGKDAYTAGKQTNETIKIEKHIIAIIVFRICQMLNENHEDDCLEDDFENLEGDVEDDFFNCNFSPKSTVKKRKSSRKKSQSFGNKSKVKKKENNPRQKNLMDMFEQDAKPGEKSKEKKVIEVVDISSDCELKAKINFPKKKKL
eukprot:UN28784